MTPFATAHHRTRKNELRACASTHNIYKIIWNGKIQEKKSNRQMPWNIISKFDLRFETMPMVTAIATADVPQCHISMYIYKHVSCCVLCALCHCFSHHPNTIITAIIITIIVIGTMIIRISCLHDPHSFESGSMAMHEQIEEEAAATTKNCVSYKIECAVKMITNFIALHWQATDPVVLVDTYNIIL